MIKFAKPLLLVAGAVFTLTFIAGQLPSAFLFEAPKALALLLAVYLLGFAALNARSRAARPRDVIDYIGAGLAVTIAYFFLVSILRALNAATLTAFLISPLALAALIFKSRRLRERFLADSAAFLRRGALEWSLFFIPLLYALLPTVFFDTLVYASGLPNFFLRNGGFVPAPQFMFANGFIYYETSLIPAVFLGDFVPRLFHFLLGALFVLAALDFGCRQFRLAKRHYLHLSILSLPLTLFLLTAEKPDLATALFIFLAVKKYLEDESRLSALFWGIAVGCKMFSVIALAVFFVLAVLLGRRLQAKKHLAMAAIVIAVLLPLLLKNGLLAGNPFFPFLSQYFPSPHWDASRLQPVAEEVGARIHSWKELLRAPIDFSFKTQGAGGMVGPIFLIFLPFLLLGKLEKEKRILLYFPLLLILASSFRGNAFRYVYVAFVFLAMVVAAVCERHESRALRVIFLAVVLVNLAVGLFTLEGIYGARQVYFDRMPPGEYVRSQFPMVRLYQMLNTRTRPDARILVAGETRGYYLKRPYAIASAHDYCILKPYLQAASSGDFAAAIKADGFAYLVFDLEEFSRLASYKPLTEAETRRLFTLLGGMKPSFHEGSLYLFTL